MFLKMLKWKELILKNLQFNKEDLNNLSLPTNNNLKERYLKYFKKSVY